VGEEDVESPLEDLDVLLLHEPEEVELRVVTVDRVTVVRDGSTASAMTEPVTRPIERPVPVE
jgi:hypothetical protein